MSTPRMHDITELSVKEINLYLLKIRYSDTQDLEESKNQELVELCKAMTLGYGSTHSAHIHSHSHARGLFGDRYHRNAAKPDFPQDIILFEQMLDYVHEKIKNQGILDNEKEQAEDFFPIANRDILKNLLGNSYDFYFIDEDYSIELSGKKIQLVKVKICDITSRENVIMNARNIIGTLSQFPNKYLQLWILANGDKAEFDKRFHGLYNHLAKGVKDECKEKYTTSTSSIEDIKNNIISLLETFKGTSEQVSKINLFQSFILDMKLESSDPEILDQIKLAFSRLEFILKNATACFDNNIKFTLFIEFAFDEIIFLNALTQHKSASQIEEVLIDFIKSQYLLDDKSSISVGLTNSGMDAIAQSIVAAISEKKSSQSEVKLYYHRDVYFEINKIMQTLSGVTISLKELNKKNEYNLTFKDDKVQLGEHKADRDKDQMYDILVCDLISSLSLEQSYQTVNFVEYQIEKQLQLRKALYKNIKTIDKDNPEINSQRKLIVMIDTTMNAFDDNHIMFILERFKEEIKSGELAIVTAHSLNKYFHMGFDKTPGGLTAGFYKKESFPELKEFYEKNLVINYTASDPIPQMIASMLGNQHCVGTILGYHHSVKKNSRLLEKIVSNITKEKSDKKNDLGGDIGKLTHRDIVFYEPAASPFDAWGFFVIHVPQIDIFQTISNILSKIIDMRAGYGYSETTYSFISDNLIRICVGAEENNISLREKFLPLITYITIINEANKAYWNDRISESHFKEVVKEINLAVNQYITSNDKAVGESTLKDLDYWLKECATKKSSLAIDTTEFEDDQDGLHSPTVPLSPTETSDQKQGAFSFNLEKKEPELLEETQTRSNIEIEEKDLSSTIEIELVNLSGKNKNKFFNNSNHSTIEPKNESGNKTEDNPKDKPTLS